MTTYERRRNVDKAWFEQRLADRQISMRGLAKLMEVDPSTVSLMVRGLRGISSETAVKMARELNVTTNELYKRAGLPIKDEAREIDVTMYIDGEGVGHPVSDADVEKISAPFDVPISGFGLQLRSGGQTDGWILIVDGRNYAPAECLGSMCLYVRKDGKTGVGITRRGYKAGLYNITRSITPGVAEEVDIDLESATPVVWIKPLSPVK